MANLSNIITPTNVLTATSTNTVTNKTLTDPKIVLGGTNGTAGQVPVSQGAGVAPVWASPPSTNFQEFTSSGTWTKPAGCTAVYVEVLSAGGGGGSGARYEAGTTRNGGGGGGGAAIRSAMFDATDIAGSVTVVVGSGGAGGAASTTNTSAGNVGANGGNSSFGAFLTSYGGSGGSGGRDSALGGGSGGGQLSAGLFANGGQPLMQTLNTSSDSQHGGGGIAISGSAGQRSVYGGGSGGGCSNAGFIGGASVNAGAGGSGGGGLDASNAVNLKPAEASGMYGLGGSSGFPQINETNSQTLSQVAFGDNKFLAFSALTPGLAYTSTDGTTWTKTLITAGTGLAGSLFNKIIHDGTQWVAVHSSTNVYTLSNDFSTGWVLKANLNTSNSGSIAFGDGLYVFVGTTSGGTPFVATSTNLTSWTTRTSGATNNLDDIIYDGVNFLACGANEFIRSTDGINWTRTNTLTQQGFRLARNGSSGRIVVLTGTAPFARFSDDSGATWTNVGTALTTSSTFRRAAIIYANSRFVAVTGTHIYNSTTASSWTTNNTQAVSGLAFGAGVAVSMDASASTTIAWSRDNLGFALLARTGPTFAQNPTAGGVGDFGCGGGGGGAANNDTNSGAGGNGGGGLVRVWAW